MDMPYSLCQQSPDTSNTGGPGWYPLAWVFVVYAISPYREEVVWMERAKEAGMLEAARGMRGEQIKFGGEKPVPSNRRCYCLAEKTNLIMKYQVPISRLFPSVSGDLCTLLHDFLAVTCFDRGLSLTGEESMERSALTLPASATDLQALAPLLSFSKELQH
ncbi:hypothetical protein llap_9069 [Limosa lapponica baueri]|uniref:Uncharacterized protein n=1 Tax=Limosa lapponica baueri TaxID=1758121 RepID=A0A2I0U3S7_LIMLA|nr:hypothetical protein llap_9069 [Limosa lapponica baueri]